MADPQSKLIRGRGGRESVRSASVQNFYHLGFHGTSMRQIAQDSNMTVASIYHHYESKQAILQDIMSGVLSDLMSQTRTALLGADATARHQLTAIVNAWILFHATRQAEAFVGSTELRSLDSAGRRLVVALRDEQEHMFRDVVVGGVDAGEFATAYPLEATRAIINMGSSVASWFDTRGSLTPQQLADRYVSLALGTVRAQMTP